MSGIEGSLLTPALDIAKGLIPGVSGVQSGSLASSSTSTQAIRATAYTEPAAVNNIEVVSANANDTSAGTGARTVRVTYMRGDGSGPFTVDVSMNGTTAVAIGDSQARFVERLEVLTAGSGGTNAGIITCRLNGAGATVGTIAASDGRTYWAHHYVALGKTCFVRGCMFGAQTVSGSCFLRKIPMLTANAFEEQITSRLRAITGQNVNLVYYENLWVAGPARITAYVTPDAVTAGSIFADIDFYEI